MPTVALEVLDLLREPNVQVSDLEQVIQHDPALAGRILRVTNSSYYGLSKPCSTVGRALTYLGLSVVKSIVLGFSLVDLSRRNGTAIDLIDYWRRCLIAAAAGRRIAQAIDLEDPEVAFIAALMQDIGVLALDSAMGPDYAPIVGSTGGDHARLTEAENAELGFEHAMVGGMLAESWRLPPELVEPIKCHHGAGLTTASSDIAKVAAIASQISQTLTSGIVDPRAVASIDRMAAELVGLDPRQLEPILHGVEDDTRELSRLFQTDVGDLPDTRMILAQAEDARLAHEVSMQREAAELQQANAELSRQALTDGLTGVANRKRFDQELPGHFTSARDRGDCMGLIMVDADRFKHLNDSLGHQAGDVVLRELARRLSNIVGRNGLVCRYGGEEFAVIMPGADRPAATRAAEAMRRAVESTPVSLASVKIPAGEAAVTASFGVSVLDESSADVLNTPDLLIRAADKALYAAKQSGRNRVLVFKTRRAAGAA